MLIKNTDARYGYVAITLHWVMAILIIGMLIVGLYMKGLPISLQKLKLYGLHKEFGILILMLVIVRLTWRFNSIIPKLPNNLAFWQKLAAHTSHILLYGFMFALPITGWMMSSTAGLPVSFFGLFTLPALFTNHHELHIIVKLLHKFLAYGLIAVLCVHILAALQHHFIYKDTTLRRMLP